MACGDVLSLEDLQTAKKHQIFEAEVITGKAGGVAGGAIIGTATNPVTGQTQQTLPSILADLGFDVQSWTSSTGGVLASANQVFLNDTSGSLGLGDYYAWGGTFPKTVPAGTDPALPTSGYIMRSSRFATTQAREALRRSYAEAGYNLVDGSFEAGGTLVNVNDVLLQERTGKAFSGPAGTVAAGTNPASGGFVSRESDTVRGAAISFASVAAMLADTRMLPTETIYCSGGTFWQRIAASSPSVIADFKPVTDVCLDDFNTLADGLEQAVAHSRNCYSLQSHTFYEPIYLGAAKNLNITLRKVIWTGAANLNNSADRLIGMINLWGGMGAQTSISGAQTEGTSTFTVADPSLFSVGDYVQLGGGKTDYICKVTGINGSNITLDYALGWDNTGDALFLRQVLTPVNNVHVRIDELVDASGTSDANAMVNGVSLITAVHSSVSIGQIYDTSYPAIFTSNTYCCEARESYLNKPRVTGAGQGYLVQWNKAHRAHNSKLYGHGGRHLIDYTRAAHCTAEQCAPTWFDNYPYSTHGAWEHDLTFTNCSVPVGKYSIALAQSGPSFGQQTKNVLFTGGEWDGDMLCDIFPTNVTFDNMRLLGRNSITGTPNYRLGGNGHFTLKNVKVQNALSSMLFRGTDAAGYPASANVYIDSGTVTGRYIEFNGITGDVVIGDSEFGQPFSSGGLVVNRFIMAGGKMNLWGGGTFNCKSFSLDGVSCFGQADNNRATIACERFIKSGGEDVQSPSFGISGAGRINLSGFNSYAGRAAATSNTYQLLGGVTCDVVMTGVTLLNRNLATKALDFTSVSANRVNLTMIGCAIDGVLDVNNTTVMVSAIIKNNRFKVGNTSLMAPTANYLVGDNLTNIA